MSVVRYVVTLSIKLDGTNARTTQRSRREVLRGRVVSGAAKALLLLTSRPRTTRPDRHKSTALSDVSTTKSP